MEKGEVWFVEFPLEEDKTQIINSQLSSWMKIF